MRRLFDRIAFQLDIISDLFGWWCHRDSNRACLVTIDVAETMTIKDLDNMRDYFESLATFRRAEIAEVKGSNHAGT